MFSEESSFRTVESKLPSLRSPLCGKHKGNHKSTEKPPVQIRILTAVLFIGSRPRSVLVNEG